MTTIEEMITVSRAELDQLHADSNANNQRIMELQEMNHQIHLRSIAVAERVNTLMHVRAEMERAASEYDLTYDGQAAE